MEGKQVLSDHSKVLCKRVYGVFSGSERRGLHGFSSQHYHFERGIGVLTTNTTFFIYWKKESATEHMKGGKHGFSTDCSQYKLQPNVSE